MFDWLTILLSPLIGAGAGSIFGKFLGKGDVAKPERPAESLGAVNRRLDKLNEWQGKVEQVLKIQEREIRRLKRSAAATRLFAFLSLLVIALAAAAWLYALHKLP